eukprot:6054625-Pyramimonas_sp.AAC.1
MQPWRPRGRKHRAEVDLICGVVALQVRGRVHGAVLEVVDLLVVDAEARVAVDREDLDEVTFRGKGTPKTSLVDHSPTARTMPAIAS